MAVESKDFPNSCVDLNFEIINFKMRTVYQIVLNSLFIILLYVIKHSYSSYSGISLLFLLFHIVDILL